MLRELFVELNAVTNSVCREIAARYAHEGIYAFNFYTHPLLSYLGDNFATEVGLKRVAEEYQRKGSFQDNWGLAELRWSPPDSPYHCLFVDRFARVDEILTGIWKDYNSLSEEALGSRLKDVRNTCIDVLVGIRDARIFAPDVVLNIVCGDQSFEERVVTAERINHASVAARYQADLKLDPVVLEQLRQSRHQWS